MKTSRRRLSFLFTLTVAGALVTACGGLVADPNFHTWCGDTLCSWKLEAGHIQRAPTWHPKDYGVELVDTPTTISQHIEATPKCLEFTTVADVAIEAQVFVGVDFDDDGTVDYEQPIAATGFTEQKTQITAPASYSNFKLIITKRGTGRAVLAQLDIDDKGDCSAAPVKLEKQAQGTACSPVNSGDECKSGVCCDGICAECCAGASANSDTCDADAGSKCGALPLLSINFTRGGIPPQCDPGKRKRAKGSECLIDADCTSGKCLGAVWNLHNYLVDGGACPAPPTPSADCNVDSVRAGICE